MKKILSLVLALAMLLTAACAFATDVEAVGGLEPNWWVDADVQPSTEFYVDGGMTVTMVGVHFNQYPTTFDGGYYFPTIEKMTGVHFDIDWRTSDGYSTVVSTILAGGIDNLPDIIQPTSSQTSSGMSVSALADEGAIIALDDYLDLIPNVVAAVGEDRMAMWRSADGHIYTIPTIVNVPGSQSMTFRKDWALKLKEQGVIDFDTPSTWEEWKAFW